MAENNTTFQKIDTINFDSTISSYSQYITQFETIVKDVDNIIKEVTGNWVGKGRDAFYKDAQIVRSNLQDISDMMYEFRDALKDAGQKYIETDEALAKSYDS